MVQVLKRHYKTTKILKIALFSAIISIFLHSSLAEPVNSIEVCPNNILISTTKPSIQVGYYKTVHYKDGLKETIFSPFKEKNSVYFDMDNNYSCKMTALYKNKRVWVKLSLKLTDKSAKVYLNYPISMLNQLDTEIFINHQFDNKLIPLSTIYNSKQNDLKYKYGKLSIVINNNLLMIKK